MTNSYQAQSSLASQAQLLSCICCYFKAAVKLPPVHLHYCLKCMHLKHDIEDLSRLPWATNLSLSFRSQNILFFFFGVLGQPQTINSSLPYQSQNTPFFPILFSFFSFLFPCAHCVIIICDLGRVTPPSLTRLYFYSFYMLFLYQTTERKNQSWTFLPAEHLYWSLVTSQLLNIC